MENNRGKNRGRKEWIGREATDFMEKWMGEKEAGIRITIGGDFNARTGSKEGGITNMEEEGMKGVGDN